MKVAIVHDYIKEYGGAERVLEALHEIWPDAPIFTTVYLPSYLGPHKERFKGWKIRTSWFQNVPFKGKLISPLRILAPFLFRSFNFSRYDVVIVSQTGAYTPNLIKKGKAVQICYTHTPPRYLYGYATARDWKKNLLLNITGTLMNHVLRLVDYKSSENVDYFVSNSENVRQRIQKVYRRDAKVIYPPVEIPSFADVKKDNYFLCGGRIAGPKHIDLIVKTFKELKLPLKVYGRTFAGYKNKITIRKEDNVEFLGEVSDSIKLELLRRAKGFVLASEDEDFGITPVEAMAVGTPVIAYKSGGFLETVIDGKTGIFFDKLTTQNLKNAILRYNKMRFDRGEIIEHAKKFSRERFKKEVREFVRKNAGTTRS
jgi:glycosyltransferase involved in cell wall biosynthesis